MMEESQVGVSQNDAQFVASSNNTSIVGGTRWASNEAYAALREEIKYRCNHWQHADRI